MRAGLAARRDRIPALRRGHSLDRAQGALVRINGVGVDPPTIELREQIAAMDEPPLFVERA